MPSSKTKNCPGSISLYGSSKTPVPQERGLATAKAWSQMLASKRVLEHFHSEKEEVQLFPYLEILVVFSLDKEMHTKNPSFWVPHFFFSPATECRISEQQRLPVLSRLLSSLHSAPFAQMGNIHSGHGKTLPCLLEPFHCCHCLKTYMDNPILN